jgi:hypothetical protein
METKHDNQTQGDMVTLANRFYELSAGCPVDADAARRADIDLPTLRKLGEAFRMGWLHNVLSRITPLTMHRMDDYLLIADLFIMDAESADHVLDRFDADLELFCSVAEITVTEHMTGQSVSDELKAHLKLYNAVADVFYGKFPIEKRDPIKRLTSAQGMHDYSNPFIKEFIDSRFNRKKP